MSDPTPTRRWMLGTPLADDFVGEMRAVIGMLRDGDAPQKERSARTAAVIAGLAETAMRHHFLGPLSRVGVGPVARKTVEVAVAMVVRSIGGPVRSVVGGLTDAQLATVADELESVLYPDPHG